MNLGNTISMIRKAKNLQQIDIAICLDVSVSTLSLLENSKRKFPPDRLDDLAQALGVPVMFIVTSSLSPKERADVPPEIMGQLDHWCMTIWSQLDEQYAQYIAEKSDVDNVT